MRRDAPGPVAALPMYDWPEVHGATDALWRMTRVSLLDAGFAAVEVPSALERALPTHDLWRSPGLLIGQTCGLPLVVALADRVTVIGAFDLGLGGCAPGTYRSALVVRAEDPRETLAEFRAARAVINESGSQSGCHALVDAVAPLADGARFFAGLALSGAHRESIRAVAAARADIAAIDAASWRLAVRHEPTARALRVIGYTRSIPAPPLITARVAGTAPDAEAARGERLVDALRCALAALDGGARDALGFFGVCRVTAADYAMLNAPATVALLAAHEGRPVADGSRTPENDGGSR